MEQTPENENSLNNEAGTPEGAAVPETETPDERDARIAELEGSNRQLFERAKKAEGFVKVDGKWVKAPTVKEAVAATEELHAKTGELEAAQLDFFDLKGYSDPEEVTIFQNVMKRTGMSHREVIKDDWALTKIKAFRDEKTVRVGTPLSTKRGAGGATNDTEMWLSKLDSGAAKLSDIPDFQTRVAVQQAKERREGDNAPPWRR